MTFNPGARWVHHRIRSDLEQIEAVYQNTKDENQILQSQLSCLNESWAESCRRSVWARHLKDTHRIPDSFTSWDDFYATVPIIEKPQLQQCLEDVKGDKSAKYKATGGSTAEPFQFPCYASEETIARTNMLRMRNQHGVMSGDVGFLLWGQSHLLGSGVHRLISTARRNIGDWAMGYIRWGAYDLSDEAMAAAFDRLLASSASYMVAYTKALERFVAVNSHRRTLLPALKVIIATAEGFTSERHKMEVQEFFQGKVKMEYGAMETGPIAYEVDRGFAPLWQTHHLELIEASRELLVTCLFPKALPLLRYKIGDLAEARNPNIHIDRIVGRANELIRLGDEVIHSELVSHAIREFEFIRGYQLAVNDNGCELRLETDVALTESLTGEIQTRLGRLSAALTRVKITDQVPLKITQSGKRPMVVER